jgi:hypothetical protein
MARLAAGRWSKWLVVVVWGVVFGAAGRPADQRPAERRLGLAAPPRRVDPGGRAGQAVHPRPIASPPWSSTTAPAAPSPRPTRPRRPPTPGGWPPSRRSPGRSSGRSRPPTAGPGRWWCRSGGRGGQRLGGAHPRVEELRSIAQADTGGLGGSVTGPAGYVADFAKVFSRVRRGPAVRHGGDRDRHLAGHLRTLVFLVALGTDDNIFLMTGVREESMRHRTRRGALIGLAATGRGGHLGRGSCWPGPWPPWAPAAGVRHRDRRGGRLRGVAGHLRGPLGAGDRAESGGRPADLVAEQPVPHRGRHLDQPAQQQPATMTP